jgi:FMN phosphatase YigB (HAD superfamily)
VIETLVFDFGNVLGFFDYGRTLELLRPYTDLNAEQMRAAVYTLELAGAYESGQLSTAAFLQQVRSACGFRCAADVLAAAWSDIFTPNEEVCSLVAQLPPRYRLLLASNTNELHALQFRRQFADTLRHFRALVLSHEIGVRKPEVAFFAHCARLAGCEPAQCLLIDDLPANVEGARACGWQGIVYREPEELKEQLRRLGVLEQFSDTGRAG